MRRTKQTMGWGSHLPVLIKVMEITDGPVLELGGGLYSTPYLHWECSRTGRKLVTIESNPDFYHKLKQYQSDFHDIVFVEDWDDAEIEAEWEVAFIDHDPAERRKTDIARLAYNARYLVVHDTEKKEERFYGYNEIYPLFKHVWKYRGVKPHTSVLSNFVDLSTFNVQK